MRKFLVPLAALCVLMTMLSSGAAAIGRDPNGTICMVTDSDEPVGLAGDARFGLRRADRVLGVATRTETAESDEDLSAIVHSFVGGGCDLIIGVGFIVAGAMEPFVVANPDQRFAVVDWVYGPRYPNVAELLFQVDEAAFMAGYVAAGISETGKVGVYGGANIAPVTIFMDGYALGVEHYNQRNGAAVDVLGWDPETRSGLLLDFEFQNPGLGRAVTDDLFDQGADTVFAVAGETGIGSLEAAAERKRNGENVRVIEPDFDWFSRYGDREKVLLTSVLKRARVPVFNTVEAMVDGTWQPGPVWEGLSSRGVDIAPYHRAASQVPGSIRRDLRFQLRPEIISGSIQTLPGLDGVACLVTDIGGVNDRGFNQTAWQGALDAAAQYGVPVRFLEPLSHDDVPRNIAAFVEADCGVIITVGFTTAEATAAAAKAHPDQQFAIVDVGVADFPGTPWCLDDPLPDGTCGGPLVANVRGSTFRTDESAFLAGYLAAGMTETGAVGTYGAIPIPTVTIFMDGFVWGVEHYNDVKATGVIAGGWDPDTRSGLFTGSFVDIDLGRTFAQQLADQGADIIFPVAGPVGFGSASFCQDTGGCLVIGVDTDQAVATPEFADVWLTSIEKGVDLFVFTIIENMVLLGSPGGEYIGTLANGGTDISPYHEFDDDVPAELKAEIDQLRMDVIDGVVVPGL